MIKKEIITLIHLLTDIETEYPCTSKQSKCFDKKVKDLINYIKMISKD